MDSITPEHRHLLEASAIALDVASEAGVRSVERAEDLPPQLGHLADQLPGLLFMHATAGGGAFPQFRPDTPAEPERKYIQAAGVAGISVHPRMRPRLGTATRALLVEGTKQHLAVVSAIADEDVLVGGMQGCWGWSSEGLASEDFTTFISGIQELVVLLDADWSSNRSVWEAGDRLRGAASMLGVAKVKFAKLPAGGKNGADDVLAAVPASQRPGAVSSLIRSASAISTRPPDQKKAASARAGRPFVDWEKASIGIPAGEDNEKGTWTELFGAAFRIIRLRTANDDLGKPEDRLEQEVMCDLEFARVIDGIRYEHAIPSVPYRKTWQMTHLLAQVPHGRAVGVEREPGKIATDAIVQAIMETAPTQSVEYLRRTGWVSRTETGGEAGYMTPSSTILADGHTQELSSKLSRSYNGVDLPDTTRLTDAECAAAFRAELDFHDHWSRPEVPIILTGALAYSVTGAPPRGSVALVGQFGGGKTWTLRWAGLHIGTENEPMMPLVGTKNALSDAGDGLHHIISTVDDARESRGEKTTLEVLEAQDALLRFGYDGPTTRKSRLTSGEVDGTYQEAVKSKTWAYFLLSAEQLRNEPGTESTVDRTLTIHIEDDSSILQGELLEDRLTEYSDAATGRIVTALIIRYLLRTANSLGDSDGARGKEVLRRSVEAERAKVAETLRERITGLRPRGAGVAAGPVVGWSLFLQAAVHYGAIDEVEAARLMKEGLDLVAETTRQHHRMYVASTEAPWLSLIYRIQALVYSGQAHFSTGRVDERRATSLLIGARTRVQGQDAIAVVPETVAALLNRAGDRTLTDKDVKRILKPVAVPDSAGNVTNRVRIGGTGQTRAVCVPLTTWENPDELANPSARTAEASEKMEAAA